MPRAAAALPAHASPNGLSARRVLPLHTRVSVEYAGHYAGRHAGTVVGHRTSLGEHSTSLRKCSQVTEIQVSFDDGETSWFASTDPALRIMKQKTVGGARRVSLRCALSLQPLVDPARGEACTHDANCNYKELRAYVARKRQCPVAGCDSAIPRSRDIVRDLQFRDSLLTAGHAGATFGYWDPISGNFELEREMHARASMPNQPRLAGRRDELSKSSSTRSTSALRVGSSSRRLGSSSRGLGSSSMGLGSSSGSRAAGQACRTAVIELDMSDEDVDEEADECGDSDHVEEGDEDGDEDGTLLCGKDGCTKPVWHSGICVSVLGHRRDQKPVQMHTAEPAPSPRELMRQAREKHRLPPAKKPKLGDRVRGKFQGQIGGRNWFDGVVTAVYEDGTCDLDYDDGDNEERVAPRFVKAMADDEIEDREEPCEGCCEDETEDREEPEEVAEPEEPEEVEVVELEDNVEEIDEVEDGDARESLRGGQGREGGCEGQGRDGGRATPNENLEVENLEVENLEVENLEVENLETTFWVQCDRCSKWRRLLNGSSSLHSSLHSNSLDGEWTCANSVLPAYSCEDDESECH